MRLVRLRLSIDPSSQILQITGCLCHPPPGLPLTTEYPPVRAHPSGRVLLHAHHQYRDPIRHPDVYLHLSHSRLWLRSPRGDFFPGHRGLLQFPRLHSHPVVADTPPVSASASDSFRSALVAFARYRQSQPPEKRVTRLLLRSFDLQPGALRTLLARVCCRRAPPSCSHATVPPMLRGLSLLTSVGLSPT